MKDGSHPLSPALLQILECCIALGTTDTRKIAAALCRSPSTIHTEFARINEALGTHSRTEALPSAVRRGLVGVDCDPPGGSKM